MGHRWLAAAFAIATMASLAAGPGMAGAATSPLRTGSADGDGDRLSDAWETRWAITDPHRVDSNGNGLPDSAEDPDGDGLGNLGEQRLRTDPTDPDTDDDGLRDSRDDADGNGRTDGRDQDWRPLPPGLHPTLDDADADRPAGYLDGCHTGPFGSAPRHCVYGDAHASFTIAAFGDSHAQQWEPALDRLARMRHWRVISITKSGCPSVDVRFSAQLFPGALPSCVEWRRRALQWLRANPPALVLLSNAGGYPLIDEQDRPIPAGAREQEWAAGLARTFADLPAESRVLVLGDTPRLRLDPLACLKRSPVISPCETSRRLSAQPGHDRSERTAARAAGHRFATSMPLVCPYDPCPLVIGRMLVWRNKGHLTATISRALAPGIGTLIDGALAPPAPTRRARTR